jgi:preprotein translocase subunit SecD
MLNNRLLAILGLAGLLIAIALAVFTNVLVNEQGRFVLTLLFAVSFILSFSSIYRWVKYGATQVLKSDVKD